MGGDRKVEEDIGKYKKRLESIKGDWKVQEEIGKGKWKLKSTGGG